MRIILLILLIVTSICVRGQEEFPILRQTLKTGRLENIRKYLSSTVETNKCWSGGGQYIRFHREILPGYFETMVDIFSCSQLNSGSEDVRFYRLNILSKDSIIFYYALEHYYLDSILWESTDRKLMHLFTRAFFDFYETPLQTEDLFNDKFTVGTICGIDGEPTELYEMVTDFVNKRDTQTLQRWLRSANTELQLYAVIGFIELYNSGFIPDITTTALLNYVLNKQGNLDCCVGCIGERYKIEDVKNYILPPSSFYRK